MCSVAVTAITCPWFTNSPLATQYEVPSHHKNPKQRIHSCPVEMESVLLTMIVVVLCACQPKFYVSISL